MLLALGFWQLDRAGDKAALQAESLRRSGLQPVDLNRDLALRDKRSAMLGRRIILMGRYTGNKVFLLDNQVVNGAAGYLVFAPFSVAGATVLVNRGWVPAGPYRDRIPDIGNPAGELTLDGTAYLPGAPLLLGEAPAEALSEHISRVQVIDLEELEDGLGRDLLPYAVRLAPGTPTAYRDVWRDPGTGRERHLGYAFQWFALAGALVIIYLYYGFVRRKQHE